MTHIMLDIETWGKTPGCDIRSIGAVVFDPVTGNVALNFGDSHRPGGNINSNSFYIATDNPLAGTYSADHYTPEMFAKLGGMYRRYDLTRDPETVKWWSEQSAEAQAAFNAPVELSDALMQFAIWLESVNPANPVPRYPDAVSGEGVRLWANDPHFDVSILDAVYRAVGLPVPWHYRAPRSMRTVVDLAGMTREEFEQFNTGTAHNALDDAIAQAKIVCECYRRLGKNNA